MTRGKAPGVEDGGGHVAALGVHEGEVGPLEAPGVQRVKIVWEGNKGIGWKIDVGGWRLEARG